MLKRRLSTSFPNKKVRAAIVTLKIFVASKHLKLPTVIASLVLLPEAKLPSTIYHLRMIVKPVNMEVVDSSIFIAPS